MEHRNIAICDKREENTIMFKQMINVFGNEEDIDINVITYDNADNLKNDLSGGKQLDILILNAEFPGMWRMDVIDWMQNMDKDVQICFIMGDEDCYLGRFYKAKVWNFYKPYKYREFKCILEEIEYEICRKRSPIEAENRYMEIESAPHNVVIDLCRVKTIQKRGKKCIFYKVDGEQVCYEPLKKIYSRLHENTCVAFTYN